MTRNNPDEDYYLFRVRDWKALPAPIAVKEEGVKVYNMTNLFLLTHCTYSYELFHIHSEEQYRLLHELKRMFDHTEMNADGNSDPVYQIDDTHSIWVHEGCFEVLNADGERLLEPIRISEFARHPREYFNLIVGKIKE